MTFGNVPLTNQNRHIAHFLVAIILMSWTMFLIWREYNHFVEVRQAWLSSPQHLSLARSRTVVITNLPDSVNSISGIKELGGVVSGLTGPMAPRSSNVTEGTAVNGSGDLESEGGAGGIKNIWLTYKVKEVEKVWQDRNDECARLEGGVGKLVKLGVKNYKKGKTPEKQGEHDSLIIVDR